MKDLKKVELFVFDLDGTVYIGDKEIEGAFATVRALRKHGRKVCFFTNNSSRTHTDYIERLARLGLEISPEEIYTSGQVTCEYLLEAFPGKKVYLLGNDRLKAEFAFYGIETVEENPDLVVLGFDTSLTYERLYRFCGYVNSGLTYIATHPDNFCPAEGCPMPDVGALTEAVRLTVGRSPDHIMGKPHTIAGRRIAARFGVAPERIAMVGDRLYTDIAFGNNCGFVSVLVLSGETDAHMAAASDIKADAVLGSVRELELILKD